MIVNFWYFSTTFDGIKCSYRIYKVEKITREMEKSELWFLISHRSQTTTVENITFYGSQSISLRTQSESNNNISINDNNTSVGGVDEMMWMRHRYMNWRRESASKSNRGGGGGGIGRKVNMRVEECNWKIYYWQPFWTFEFFSCFITFVHVWIVKIMGIENHRRILTRCRTIYDISYVPRATSYSFDVERQEWMALKLGKVIKSKHVFFSFIFSYSRYVYISTRQYTTIYQWYQTHLTLNRFFCSLTLNKISFDFKYKMCFRILCSSSSFGSVVACTLLILISHASSTFLSLQLNFQYFMSCKFLLDLDNTKETSSWWLLMAFLWTISSCVQLATNLNIKWSVYCAICCQFSVSAKTTTTYRHIVASLYIILVGALMAMQFTQLVWKSNENKFHQIKLCLLSHFRLFEPRRLASSRAKSN